jgi:hypothetical protein
MKTKLLTLILLILFAANTKGANYYLLTDIGSSARTIALGNIEGFSNSAATVFENPAGLYRIKNSSASFFTTTLMNELHYNSIAICSETPIGKIGIGYMETTVSSIPHTALNQHNFIYAESYYDYKSSLIKFSYMYPWSKEIYLGASFVNYRTAFWTMNGEGNDLDLGLIYDDQSNLVVSFIMRNTLSSKVSFSNDSVEDLPTQYLFAAKYKFYDVDFYGQIKQKFGKMLLAGGISYKPSFIPYFEINAGYKNYLVLNTVKNNITFGVGLILYGLNVFYTYEKSDHFEFDNKNYFSVSINY